MTLLLTEEAKMLAAACLIISVLLVVRAFTINKNTGRRRFGWKAFLFLSLTLGMIVSIRIVQQQKIETTYQDVATVNKAITQHDIEYRTAKNNFQAAFENYATTIQELQPTGEDVHSDLLAIGSIAEKTLLIGKETIKKFDVLKASSQRYQETLSRAGSSYRFANANLNKWADEEDALLLQSSELIRKMAKEEEYSELSDAYSDLASVFEKLSQMSEARYAEVEVNMPALEEAMHYVVRANIYLQTVHTHASTLASFHSPEEILTDIAVYQQGVKQVTESIRALNEQLDQVKATQFKQASY